MCDSQNAMMHQFSADNYYTFATENSQYGPDRGFRKIRPIIAGNAARERTRVKTLRSAFLDLQRTLPAVPPDTKLSKLDVLVLATTYIAHLMRTLNEGVDDNQLFAANGIMHPVKVWELSSHFLKILRTFVLFGQIQMRKHTVFGLKKLTYIVFLT